MAVNLSPVLNETQFKSDGSLAVSYKIYTYAEGSTTPLTTYTTSTGATPQANPIILNSRGESDNPIWLTAGLGYKFVLKTDADVTIKTEDNIHGVNDTSVSADQWASSGLTPTYVSATSFTLSGDQTAAFHVGRRLKSTVTAGTAYSTISVSAYGALTTITVVNDSTALDAGLSAVSYGLLTYTNNSIPTVSSGMVLIASATASSSATIDFTSISNTVYNSYVLVGDNIAPATNATYPLLRISQAGVFNATASSYVSEFFRYTYTGSGLDGDAAGGGATAINLSSKAETLGTGANQVYGFVAHLGKMTSTAFKRVSVQGEGLMASGGYVHHIGGGQFVGNSTDVDGFRILMSSGNIASGTFKLYGLKA